VKNSWLSAIGLIFVASGISANSLDNWDNLTNLVNQEVIACYELNVPNSADLKKDYALNKNFDLKSKRKSTVYLFGEKIDSPCRIGLVKAIDDKTIAMNYGHITIDVRREAMLAVYKRNSFWKRVATLGLRPKTAVYLNPGLIKMAGLDKQKSGAKLEKKPKEYISCTTPE